MGRWPAPALTGVPPHGSEAPPNGEAKWLVRRPPGGPGSCTRPTRKSRTASPGGRSCPCAPTRRTAQQATRAPRAPVLHLRVRSRRAAQATRAPRAPVLLAQSRRAAQATRAPRAPVLLARSRRAAQATRAPRAPVLHAQAWCRRAATGRVRPGAQSRLPAQAPARTRRSAARARWRAGAPANHAGRPGCGLPRRAGRPGRSPLLSRPLATPTAPGPALGR
jgi:hypothetical protein